MDLSKVKQGATHVKPKGGGGKRFTPLIYWKEDQEAHYVAFLTPVAEIVTVDVHTYQTKKGWRTFICRKNDAFADESGGFCELCDSLDDSPVQKHLAIAAELETVEKRVNGRRQITDLNLKMVEVERDGETREYPRFGLIMQSASNFYNYLTAYDAQRQDITTLSFEIVRSGKKSNTSYNFFPVDMRPDLSEYDEQVPNLLEYLAEKGSAEYYAEELGEDVGTATPKKAAPVRERQSAETTGASDSTDESVEDQFERLRNRLETK